MFTSAFGMGKFILMPSTNQTCNVVNTFIDYNIASKVLYTRNTGTNDFQFSDSKDGSLLTVPNRPVNIRVGSYITSITPNTSITLSSPITTSGTSQTLTFRPKIDVMKALIKNWSVTF